jgi:hypothetical protein
MILDDWIMLGKTVPEVQSDGRTFVCTAGYSPELRQPVRIYPMALRDCPGRWSVCRVPLERNPKDARPESWKLRGDRSPGHHEMINRVIERLPGKVDEKSRRQIVKDLLQPSIKAANERRLSLCVLKPKEAPQIIMEESDTVDMAPTPDLFIHPLDRPVAKRFPWHPRIKFIDQDGHKHDLMLRDWGCYELMRKRPDCTPSLMSEALGIASSPLLFCGNLNRFRNAWLVISVFGATLNAQTEEDQQMSLFAMAEETA